MAENKTQGAGASVDAFLESVEPPQRREDGRTLCALFARISGEPPQLWGPSIIGFGRYRYRYESGREGETARISFSPRKPQLVFYGLLAAPGADELLGRLGRHSTGKGCVYVKKLQDIDLEALEELARAAFEGRKPDEIA